MTSLNDKAETPENVAHSIEDAAETDATYRIRSLDLDPAEEVGGENYPQYGDWLPAEEVRDGAAIGDVWVECPRGLAVELVDAEVDDGDEFGVTDASKSPAGEWQVSVDVRD